MIALAVAAYRLFERVVFGGDPAADADIGGGLVPVGVAVIVTLAWSFVDGKRSGARRAGTVWGVACGFAAVAAVVRSLAIDASDIGGLVAFVVLVALLLAVPAAIGTYAGAAQRPST